MSNLIHIATIIIAIFNIIITLARHRDYDVGMLSSAIAGWTLVIVLVLQLV